jgi:hypothetical protein
VPQPSEQEITRSLSSLRACAQAWDDAGMKLANAHQQWSGLLADGLAFGIFVPVGLAYQKACDTLATAGAQGVTRLGDVSLTLFDVANAYEKDEEHNVHLAQGKW